MNERPDDPATEDPTIEADQADPNAPGPGDSDGARPEVDPRDPDEESKPPEPTGGVPDDAADSSPDGAAAAEPT